MTRAARTAFAFSLRAGELEDEAVTLVESIRRFAGSLSGASILAMVPAGESASLRQRSLDVLKQLGVEPTTFDVDPEVLSFPYGMKVIAAGAAERLAARHGCERMIWMDADSLVIRDPAPVLPPADAVLGYRPVDHTLIGSRADEPIDAFWRSVYDACGVDEESLFTVTASVDQQELRAYVNAGLLIVQPRAQLLGAWARTFLDLYLDVRFVPFYERDHRYKIFIHQALFAGVVLRELTAAQLHLLDHRASYPLHMHADYPAHRRATSLGDLYTCRYDTLFDGCDWRSQIVIDEPWRSWLDRR
ncbi:MAG: hypothetical protein KAS72_03275 [Phycisphaerales bacterium]|nr:hypothetical protein [Phycisphaerales bacterium]